MKIVKRINNNFAIGLDNKGKPLIVQGKGIGFGSIPYELDDLSRITRTYYEFDNSYIELLKDIDLDVLNVANEAFNYAASTVNANLKENLPLVMADHIQFCIERKKQGMKISIPLYFEINTLYPKEMKVAQYTLHLIKNELSVELDSNEAVGIAMNIINGEITDEKIDYKKQIDYIKDFVSILEKRTGKKVDQSSFYYSRFVNHMKYLFHRILNDQEKRIEIPVEDEKMLHFMQNTYPEVYQSVMEFDKELDQKDQIQLSNSEILYLMLHASRLCK